MKILITALIVLMLCSCSNVHNVSAEKFEAEYKNSKIVHTMNSYQYLGEKEGKVYLKKSSMSFMNQKKWNDEIFIVSLDELSDEIKDELKSKNKTYTE